MAKINFKTVSTVDDDRRSEVKRKRVPIGIRTPVKLGQGSDGIFSMHYNLQNQIKDNLRNLILTNHGERPGQYDLGANLRELTMELSSDEFDLNAMTRIKTAVGKYMPFITLQDFESHTEDSGIESVAKVKMIITYAVPSANIAKDQIEISLFFGA